MNDRSITAPGLLWRRLSLDPVWCALGLLLLVLLATVPEQGATTLLFLGTSLTEVAPFLLLSVGIAAYAQASGADALIARAFQGRTAGMIVLAALFGGLSPFCSCGVIPLIAALLVMGVPLAPVMAFWLSSPIMDPSMFVLTAGVLGLPFAIAKTIAAIGLGLFGGFGTLLLQRLGAFDDPLRPGVGDGGCAGNKVRTRRPVVWRFWEESDRVGKFRAATGQTLLFLGKWLALAYTLESLMLAYVPAELISDVVGGSGWSAVGLASVVGVPAYMNGYAALPLVGGLIEQGMAPGPAMAFLVAGGVTSVPAAVAVFALARLPVFAAFVAFALIGSIAAGLLYGGFAA